MAAKVTIAAKSLQSVRQAAKELHTRNATVSVSKDSVTFELSGDGGIDHEVEGVLDLDGRAITLRKVYTEIWTKKRGSAEREFTGHTTDHYIDGVPVKKGEYEAQIASIIGEDAFKLLTNPRHFNEVLHWTERRKLLMEVCGDVSDEDVIGSDSKLATLPNILNGRKLEDHRKVITARRSEINKEIERIPIRISEVRRGLPAEAIAPTNLAELQENRNKKSQELANLEAGGGIAEKTKELREVESEMLKIQNAHLGKTADKMRQAKVDLRNLEDETADLAFSLNTMQRDIASLNSRIEIEEGRAQQLRDEWHKVSAYIPTFSEGADACPTCGQSLPQVQVEAARDKALTDFNLNKASELERINTAGKVLKVVVGNLKIESVQLQEAIIEKHSRQVKLQAKIPEAAATVASLEKQEGDYISAPTYITMANKKASIGLEIAQLKANDQGAVETLKLAISAIATQIADCEGY